jgi:pimeloyl-ACP methyl ester carboxylesterase
MSEFVDEVRQLPSGLKLHYYRWRGPGPALVLLHTSAGYARMWEHTASLLAPHFDVIAPDQRAHGDSDRPDGSYTAEEYAADVRHLLTDLGVERAVLAGHSLGGRVAQAFAGTYPDAALALALVGGPHYTNFWQERRRVEAMLERVHQMLNSQTTFSSADAALVYLRTVRPDDSDDALRHRVWHNPRPAANGAVEMKYDKVRVAQTLAHMADDLSVHARNTRCPVAIIRITRNPGLTREEAARLAEFWKRAEVVEVDAALLPEMENPAGLAEAIRLFVARRVSV